jgi:hypothetical protein
MNFQPRYEPGKYRDCRFCHGRGCACCDGEAEKAYKRAFPEGPKPIATFNLDSKHDVDRFVATFHVEKLESAFGEGGGGVDELVENLRRYDEEHSS